MSSIVWRSKTWNVGVSPAYKIITNVVPTFAVLTYQKLLMLLIKNDNKVGNEATIQMRILFKQGNIQGRKYVFAKS